MWVYICWSAVIGFIVFVLFIAWVLARMAGDMDDKMGTRD